MHARFIIFIDGCSLWYNVVIFTLGIGFVLLSELLQLSLCYRLFHEINHRYYNKPGLCGGEGISISKMHIIRVLIKNAIHLL